MAYVTESYEGDVARERAAENTYHTDPGMGHIPEIYRLELLCSEFSDPGPDWCEWRAFDYAGYCIKTKYIKCY